MNKQRRAALKRLGIMASAAAAAAPRRELRIEADIAPFRQGPKPPAEKDLQAYLLV